MIGDCGDVGLAWVQEEVFSEEACMFLGKTYYKRTSPRRFDRTLACPIKTWKFFSNRVSVAVEFSIRQP